MNFNFTLVCDRFGVWIETIYSIKWNENSDFKMVYFNSDEIKNYNGRCLMAFIKNGYNQQNH
jgi:hypothetical protein